MTIPALDLKPAMRILWHYTPPRGIAVMVSWHDRARYCVRLEPGVWWTDIGRLCIQIAWR